MTRYLLDTNIVSETSRPDPSPSLRHWIAQRKDTDLWIASMTVAELRRGIATLPAGARRRKLEAWFGADAGPLAFFHDRILSFDLPAALHWARLIADGQRAGRPRSPLDMIIAATALAHDCILVSGNERHFRGVIDVINPLDGSVSAD